MTGIWLETEDGWRPLASIGFALEKELHDLIERSPGMLPLAGSPRLVMLGREVRCGTGKADLVAVEADTGVPVVIEVKLASNTDRRAVLTQVLGYAAYLRRLDAAGFEALLAPHLLAVQAPSVGDAVTAAVQDPAFDVTAFANGLAESLAAGRLRCAVVIDAAPQDLVELLGYLQDVTNDRLELDLVTVTAYRVGERRVLVPQLVEPERVPALPPSMPTSAASQATITQGSDVFAATIEQSPEEQRPVLWRLHDWAVQLESDGLAVLYSSTGKGRWVLNPRLPGQPRGLVTIWNENGGSLSPYRTVLQQEAPNSLAALDDRVPGQIKQGNYLKADYDDHLLGLFRAAYEEAKGSTAHMP
ncbi:MAG: hypothetical protein M3415_02810 [Actinomycetota bacterium]|jgi:hypothetical protein|nr:hypothetical protein [Actinomycetota bacterium]